MTCATCGRQRPSTAFLVRRRRRWRSVRWCGACRAAYRARIATGPRATNTHPRALKTNPRVRGTNPRALGTNPHPGKTEQAGQWRAAWRRAGQYTPEESHAARMRLERALAAQGPTSDQHERLERLVAELGGTTRPAPRRRRRRY